MTAHQQQLRRGTSAQCDAMTPAVGEPIVDTSNNRIRIGDGSRAGGFSIPNAFDLQQNAFNFAVAGGTANALTVTLSPAPAAYNQPLAFWVKATATNTGATTINVNSLGLKNIYKVSGGSISALTAGDIVNGGLYLLIYDSTQFQLFGLQTTGLVSVSQGDLNTSTGTFSAATGGLTVIAASYNAPNPALVTMVTLPGGEYGFFPLTGQNSASTGTMSQWIPSRFNSTSNAAVVAPWGVRTDSSGSFTVKGSQRYITSSPPFDLGDGEAGGFIFVTVNNSGEVVAHYSADVPPWGYNGPTDIRCTHKCPITGKKFRTVPKKLTAKQFMDGAKIEYQVQEITHQIKNADMGLIPHPFGTVPDGHHVVIIDHMSDKVRRLIELQNSGDTQIVREMVEKGYLKIDNEFVSRKGPQGVKICAAKYRSK